LNEQKVFHAVVGKEGGWWNIWVPELDQVTCTRKSRKIAGYTRTLIAAILGIPESSFRVERELVSAAEFERRYTAAARGTDAQEKL